MTFLCPHCQHCIQNIAEECSVCGEIFEPSQWPSEAYSLEGMRPKLKISWGDTVWEPSTNEFVIARDPGINGLELKGKLVSSTRARVYCRDSEWFLQKENKQVRVNGLEIDEVVLKPGDAIEFGPYLLKVSIDYVPNTIEQERNGRLCSAAIEKLDNSRIYIGSNSAQCRILIDTADELHALIYHRKEDDSWWLADCASSTGVKVNNVRIHNKRLYPSDKITISGIDFLYTGTELNSQGIAVKGLDISLEKVYAVGRNDFQILHEMSLHISPGEFVGVLGPSACGKSSLIQRLVGLARFSSGEMRINGHPIEKIKDNYKSSMAYLPQQNVLHNDLTLREEFSCFRSLHNENGKSIHKGKVIQVLRLLGLENDLDKPISALSGGQMRRAGIALSLLRNPRMLVLDEPTSGLDPATETDVMTYLRRISNQGKTVVCSTHILGNIDLFDKILVISRGHLVFWGTPNDLLEYFKIQHPHSLYKIFASGDVDKQRSTAAKFSHRYTKTLAPKYASSGSMSDDMRPTTKSTGIKQIVGYWKRMLYELLNFRHSEKKVKAFFLESPCFFQLILQPLAVALTLKMACAYNFFSTDGRKEVMFFAAATVFWLGMNSSIRELVKERIPWRCLERLERIPVSVYLTSKVLWMTLLFFIQTTIFSFFLFDFKIGESLFHILPNFSIVTPSTTDTSSIILSSSIFLVLFVVCAIGGIAGLGISAIFKKENTAIAWLPIVLIPIMFFSQPIIRNDNYGDISVEGNGHYTKLAIAIENVMPCNAAECLMDRIYSEPARMANDKSSAIDDTNKAKSIMIRNAFLWILLFLAIMIWRQNKNETQWDGR